MRFRMLIVLFVALGCAGQATTETDPVVATQDAAVDAEQALPDGMVATSAPDATRLPDAPPAPTVDAKPPPVPVVDAKPPPVPVVDAKPPPVPVVDAKPPPRPDAAPPPPAPWTDLQKCENMCQTYCVHKYMCDGSSISQCRMNVDDSNGGTCEERAHLFSDIPQSRVQACIDAVVAMSCPTFLQWYNTGQGTPSACVGILS